MRRSCRPTRSFWRNSRRCPESAPTRSPTDAPLGALAPRGHAPVLPRVFDRRVAALRFRRAIELTVRHVVDAPTASRVGGGLALDRLRRRACPGIVWSDTPTRLGGLAIVRLDRRRRGRLRGISPQASPVVAGLPLQCD